MQPHSHYTQVLTYRHTCTRSHYPQVHTHMYRHMHTHDHAHTSVTQTLEAPRRPPLRAEPQNRAPAIDTMGVLCGSPSPRVCPISLVYIPHRGETSVTRRSLMQETQGRHRETGDEDKAGPGVESAVGRPGADCDPENHLSQGLSFLRTTQQTRPFLPVLTPLVTNPPGH